jgi:hypothetical protein
MIVDDLSGTIVDWTILKIIAQIWRTGQPSSGFAGFTRDKAMAIRR